MPELISFRYNPAPIVPGMLLLETRLRLNMG